LQAANAKAFLIQKHLEPCCFQTFYLWNHS